jgi:hypothetical protein
VIADTAYLEGILFPPCPLLHRIALAVVSGGRGLRAGSFADEIRRVEVNGGDVPHVIGMGHLPPKMSRWPARPSSARGADSPRVSAVLVRES